MKKINIFGMTHEYDFYSCIEPDITVIRELMKKIREPQILCYSGWDTVDIYITGDEHSICRHCIEWIYEQNKEKVNEPDIRACLLKCSLEDKEWTEWRNRDSADIWYRKITFLPEIQDMVCSRLDKYLQDLNTMYADMVSKEQKQKAETERQRGEWKVAKTFKHIRPKGGEFGTDGYIDAEYESKNGETVRMVSLDLFDMGCFWYPKRLEGSRDASDRESWTEPEKQLGRWLCRFGEFHGVRM